MAGHFENGLNRFLLRFINEGAGIYHDDVSPVRLVRHFMAGLLGEAEHHFGIYEVLRTSERDKTNFHKSEMAECDPPVSDRLTGCFVSTVWSATDTFDEAFGGKESFPVSVPGRKSKSGHARCPYQTPSAARFRTVAGQDTTRRILLEDCVS